MKMKTIAMAVLIAASPGVFAAAGGEGGNTGCNGQGNPNSPCEPTDNGGGSDPTGYGNIAKANSRSISNSNARSNSKSIGVGVGVGGDASSRSRAAGGNSNVSTNVTVEGTDFDDYVASTNHISPEPTAPCIVTGGAHLGVPGFIGGASGGIVDRNCEMRENIRLGLSSDNMQTKQLANNVLQAKLVQDLEEITEERRLKVNETRSSDDNVWAFQDLGG